jgi:hypothetical protein
MVQLRTGSASVRGLSQSFIKGRFEIAFPVEPAVGGDLC